MTISEARDLYRTETPLFGQRAAWARYVARADAIRLAQRRVMVRRVR